MEADIVKCFDNIPKNVIISVLKHKILDERFINLIRKFLNSGSAYFNEAPVYDLAGIPQGSILSPILCNIVLHEMDKYVLAYMSSYNVGERIQRNYKQRYKLVKKNFKGAFTESAYNDCAFRKMVYVRYADDFVVGIRGTLKEAKSFTSSLEEFLVSKFKLRVSIKIVNLSKNYCTFLGARFRLSNTKMTRYYNTRCGKFLKRRSNKRLKLYAPLKTITNKLALSGFIKKGVIVPQFK